MISIMNRYSDEEFASIVQQSSSYKDCLQRLGYQSCSGKMEHILQEKIQRLGLSTEHFCTLSQKNMKRIIRTPENVFCENSTADQKTLRTFYLKEHPQKQCAICGQNTVWNNKPLTLILDHINGHNHDNRLTNLRWICPNCNIQLDTTNGKHNKCSLGLTG